MKVKLKDIASFSKGVQIKGADLLHDAKYVYLNGGIHPSGEWDEYNVDARTVTISEGGVGHIVTICTISKVMKNICIMH
jgi:type I restriction enzyme S subunit